MRALYHDMQLTDEQVSIVRAYLHEVDFRLPNASPDDFEINRRARYLGYMFQNEDLEAFGVGLKCTKPGMEGHNTYIRMSREQLLGVPTAKILPVNPPALAGDNLLMRRFRKGVQPSQLETGIDVYVNELTQSSTSPSASGDSARVPGGDLDLAMIEAQFSDIVDFLNKDEVWADQEILDLRILWGTLLAGRYSRLKHFQKMGSLTQEQSARLDLIEQRINEREEELQTWKIATLKSLTQPIVQDG